MTEQPPTDPAATDELADLDDEVVEVADDFGSPDVVALVAFVLAVASIGGFGLLDGSSYFFLTVGTDDSIKSTNVLSALLGAVFALLPVSLGWRASSRALDSDPRWVATAARAAVILGLLAAFLQLVIAIFAAAAPDAAIRFDGF